jgi:outer membrane lipoprotein-sorting protein
MVRGGIRTTIEAGPARERAGTAVGRLALLLALGCAATGAVAAPAGPAGGGTEASGLLDRVIGRYENASSYVIDFEEDLFWALADTHQVARGELAVERPSLVSVRYDDGGRIVVTAESLRVFVPATNQFFSAPVDSSDVVIDPARLLRQYVPDPSAPVPSGGSGVPVVVALEPRSSGASLGRLLVTIDPEGLVVTQIVASSPTGDRTTYRIGRTRFDVAVPPGDFVLRRPPGAELIRGAPAGAH